MRKLIFLLLFLAIFILPSLLYLGWSLGHWWDWPLLTLLFGLTLSFPMLRHGQILVKLSFLSMGVLSYLIVFCLLKDALLFLGYPFNSYWIYLATLAAVAFGSWVAHNGPRIKKVRLFYPDLPHALDGFKVAQISDLHIGPTIGEEYVARVVTKVNELKADLVALTGDIGDGPVERHRIAIAQLSRLSARYGAFFVPGNHEYYWNANEWMNVMNNSRIIVLLNRFKIIQHHGQNVLVGGVADPAGHPGPDLEALTTYKDGEKSDLRILLSHRPGIAMSASAKGFHLMLAGHTHGGQFFPWTLLVRFFHHHVLGVHKLGDMWLYVNSGTGSWGPFLRLGTTSEITLIELLRSDKSLE